MPTVSFDAQVNGKAHRFQFNHTNDSEAIIKEIFSDNYKVIDRKVEFRPGDFVLDLGANEGMFSVFIGTVFPQVKIIALEPVPRTYFQLVNNLELNGVKNVIPLNIGVGKPGQGRVMINVSKDFSGGSTSLCTYNPDHHERIEVGMVPLDDIFEMYRIGRCRLLKIDIEGMEYDALYNSTVLDRVDYFAGEFHMNAKLDYQGRRADGLITWVSNQTDILHVNIIKMAE